MNLLYDQTKLNKICNDRGISYLALFGSYARKEETIESDVDLLARFNRPISLFDLVETQDIFQSFFGIPVDLVPEKSLKPRIRPYVVKDLKTIYEKR